MMLLLQVLGWLFCAMAVFGAAFSATAAVLFGRFLARPQVALTRAPGVTLLKPLHGADAWLADSLEGYCRQDYPGDLQMLFGVQDPTDPAVAVVKQLQGRHPHLDIGLVVDARLHGPNRKVSNLINIVASARHDVLIMSDADVRVPPDYVAAVVAALDEPGVGAVTCLYLGQPERGLWSRAAAMAIDYDFLPSAVLAKVLHLAEPCFGPTIAMTRQVMTEIGGLEAFSRFLAEDFEFGRAVRARGYAIAIPPMVMTTLCTESSLGQVFKHELRWARTIRRIAGAGHVGSVVTHPLPLSLAGALLLGGAPMALGLVFAILVVRILVKLRIDAATRANAGPWWLIPLRDVLSFAVFMASFFGAKVEWQGQRFSVGRDGALTEL